MTRWPSLLRPRAGQRRAQKRHGTRLRSSKPTFTVGFGFRVLIGPGEVKSSESVSGFGFRVLIGPGEVKPSGSVSGFGLRSALGKLSLQSRFRVSGFDRSWGRVFRVGFRFRVSGFGFRASIGPGEVKSSESVSGFGFRSSKPTLTLSRFVVSGFGFRWSKPTLQTSLRITSLEIHRNPWFPRDSKHFDRIRTKKNHVDSNRATTRFI